MGSYTEYDRKVLLAELEKAKRDKERGEQLTETSEHRLHDLVSLLRDHGVSEQEITETLGPDIEVGPFSPS